MAGGLNINASFSRLDLPAALLSNLNTLGYTTMTPVQAQSLPVILQGKDVVAQAETGSGKTAAFSLGILAATQTQERVVQALVLSPTRELADQIATETRRLAQTMHNLKVVSLCGGRPIGPQKTSLQHGAHVVVGTPGRILDHLKRRTLQLDTLRVLVLDEADRMLDMGFAEDITEIARQTPGKRQTLLFSATYPESITQMSRQLQRQPKRVTVAAEHTPGAIEQLFFEVHKHERTQTLQAIFEHYQPASALVFCRTREQCDQVAEQLNEAHIQSLALHGNLDQRARDQVLLQFTNGSCPVLVATDVAARGLDIQALEMVINYELPHDAEVYQHRIGRTGRAGRTGLALSICTPAEQVRMQRIEAFTGQPAICDVYASLDRRPEYRLRAPMTTLEINAGRKQKLRAGDLLGALTVAADLPAEAIGKINIFDQSSYVAVDNRMVQQALEYLHGGKVKGRMVKARLLLMGRRTSQPTSQPIKSRNTD
ncbi:MAG: ATP-dependent RNA helicase DbpA [Pseudomonadota bacterium]